MHDLFELSNRAFPERVLKSGLYTSNPRTGHTLAYLIQLFHQTIQASLASIDTLKDRGGLVIDTKAIDRPLQDLQQLAKRFGGLAKYLNILSGAARFLVEFEDRLGDSKTERQDTNARSCGRKRIRHAAFGWILDSAPSNEEFYTETSRQGYSSLASMLAKDAA